MMDRVLLIAPQWIGDAVMSEPLVAALSAQGSVVTVAALPWVAPVYRAMPRVASVIELPFAHGRLDLGLRWRIGRSWRQHYDAAYVLPNSLKAALMPWFAGIATRVGYEGESRWGLLNRRLPNPGGRPPMVPFYLALAGAADGPAPRPVLKMPAERLAAALVAASQSQLEQAVLQPGRYWAFAPGAEYGPAKCWPAAHYAQLAQALHARDGLPVLLLGSGKEAALAAGIQAAAPGACLNLIGRTTLDQAMALIAGARGMVSNDSGLMHVAAAFGVSQVAVFGSTSPEHTPPLNPRARVLWLKEELKLDCAPCFDRQCRFGHTRCLTELSPSRVQAALDEALLAQ
jgi:heptosyltransferase-2